MCLLYAISVLLTCACMCHVHACIICMHVSYACMCHTHPWYPNGQSRILNPPEQGSQTIVNHWIGVGMECRSSERTRRALSCWGITPSPGKKLSVRERTSNRLTQNQAITIIERCDCGILQRVSVHMCTHMHLCVQVCVHACVCLCVFYINWVFFLDSSFHLIPLCIHIPILLRIVLAESQVFIIIKISMQQQKQTF